MAKISLQELTDLASCWSDEGDALSVYLQVQSPTELAYREESIMLKEKLQKALGGAGAADRRVVQRLMETVAQMKGNNGRAKVIFACAEQNIWREYDVPGEFDVTVDMGNAFTLAPLIAQQQGRRRYCIALADRNRARLLLLEAREITEHSQVLDEDKEKIRTTGTSKSVHLERKKDEQVRKHFTFLAENLLHSYEHKDYDCLLIGCRDEMWPEIEAELHPDLKRILMGRFVVDPGLATREEIFEKAQALVGENDRKEELALVEKAVGGAAAHGLGAVGLPAVIDALEKGEVRTVLWSNQRGTAEVGVSLCSNCGHLEAEKLNACSLCGARMRTFAHAEEALLRHALGRSLSVHQLHYSQLPPDNSIAAWLRFRADTNTAQALAS